MTPQRKKELSDALQKRAADLLVEFGYATCAIVGPAGGRIDWTPTGEVLRDEIQKVHDALIEKRGETGKMEAIAMIGLFVITRH